MPKYFCATCIIRLNAAYQFREQCELTQEKLLRSLETVSETESKTDLNITIETADDNATVTNPEDVLLDDEMKAERIDIKEEVTDDQEITNTTEQRDYDEQTDNQCIENIQQPSCLQTDEHEKMMDTENNPLICHESIESWNCKSQLKRLQERHIGVELFKCGQCTTSFATHHDLQLHQTSHTTYKPFKCVYCAESYFSQLGLTAHQKTHRGE